MLGRLRNPYRALEKSIGYRFRRRRLLEAALTHRSYRCENTDVEDDNQRLEFLGDAVLGFLTAADLYGRFQNSQEGSLTALRSRTNSGKALAGIARDVDLGRYLRMGKGEEKCGGRERDSNLADALEAVLGAAYMDGGVRGAERMFRHLAIPLIEELRDESWADNPKGKLQELAQRGWGTAPQYRITRRDGPPHASIFTVEVTVAGVVFGTGSGTTKQEAEARAAETAISNMDAAGLREGDRPRRRRRRRRSRRTDARVDSPGSGFDPAVSLL